VSAVNVCFDEAVGATDVGRRSHNEDAYLLRPELGLLVVADGVGGHLAGEVASFITCETIEREMKNGNGLEAAVRCANRAVMAAVESGRGKHGMASTVVAMRMHGADYELAWVGDSRAYLWDGQLKLLTRDHSLVEVLLQRGQASREELKTHHQRNVIVQSIGLQADSDLKVGINRGSLHPGEILMLCSDGLSDVLDNAVIAELMNAGSSLQERCQRLVTSSIEQGGKDNSTVILVSGATGENAGLSPNIVWSFDPASGELLVRDVADPEIQSAPKMKKVGPKPGQAMERTDPTTQMMSVAELERALPAERGETVAGEPGTGWGPWPWVGGLLVAAAVAALAVWYVGGAG
jgi:serine/threonine protein phosphatase PrpC